MIDNFSNYDILNLLIGKADFFCQDTPLVCEVKRTAFPTNRRTRGFLLEDDMISIERKRELNRNDYWRHREKRLSTHKKYRDRLAKEQPWIKKFWSIKQRCTDLNCSCYSRYGGKGIKLFLTKNDLKTLWFRDKAFLLQQPSIDRIDNSGNYELNNCRFIEMIENSRRERKIKPHFICLICKTDFIDYPSRKRIVCSKKCLGILMSRKMKGNTYAKVSS